MGHKPPPMAGLTGVRERASSAAWDRRRVLGLLGTGAGVAALGTAMGGAGEPDERGAVPTGVHDIQVQARPIAHFERAKPDVHKFGVLEYRGGVVLSSASDDFGGWSGLVIEPDGSGLLAISDVGSWMSAEITYEGTRPSGLRHAKIGPLRDATGQPLRSKMEQDAESVALLDGTLAKGTLLVGFERDHRIVRYPVVRREVGAAGAPLRIAPDAKRMPKNQGFEAVTVLKGGPHKGSIVAFSERFTRGSGYHSGWIWINDEPQKFQMKDIDVFDVTDAASLDNGDLLVLERRFRWTEGVQMRLRRIEAAEVTPGARTTGHILLQVDGSFEIDNMEGLAVHRDAAGQQVVTLMSDDNFNGFLQRTLLLQFTLAESGKAAVRT